MSEQKPKRRYNSTRRQEQANQTRRQIVDAAKALFVEKGYSGTTLDAVAQQAGVAVETIYATFGSKRAILSQLVDLSVVGEQKPIPLLDRTGPQVQDHGKQQIRLFVHDMREILERTGPIFEIMYTAAKTEPDIAGYLRELQRERLEGMAQFIQYWTSENQLRQGLYASEAADTLWALTSADTYRCFTVGRDWTGDQYEDWLAKTLIRLLI